MKLPLQLFHPVVILCLLTSLLRAASDATAPEISLSLRGLVDDSLEQGEPLRVAVRLESPNAGTGTVELAPATGTWVDAVVVELSVAGSNAVIARASPVGTPASPRAILDRSRVAGGLWLFAESSTRGIAAGDYVVRARLSLKGNPGWSGAVVSEEMPLRIIALSSAPERVSARTLARAQIAFSAGAFEEAARLLDGVLAKTPDDFELLCLRAAVALNGDNPLAAMICVNRAAGMLSPKAPGPPPLMLVETQAHVYQARGQESPPSANPPGWTWPPSSVLLLPGNEALKFGDLPTITVPGPNAPTPAATPARSAARPNGTVVPAAELIDAKIIADPAGLWATKAIAGTQYGRTQYSAQQATGAPNIFTAGNSPDAWCSENKDRGTDWLEVTFAQPTHATEIRVRQNDAAGAITKIEAIEPDGTSHVWWEGVDAFKTPAVREIVWFAVRVPQTGYLVAKVRITLNLAAGPGWKEIDAVQLVGSGQ
ncbi:MAG: hypothetical protein HYV95_14650 [Opitutae bacterium]|nr:hypothetical protein [Opitutae bacterium]